MIRLSREARIHVAELRSYYRRNKRPEATRNLGIVLARVADRISGNPDSGLPAPRPYPDVAREGVKWIKDGAYWIAFRVVEREAVIVGVFHEAADIPGRL